MSAPCIKFKSVRLIFKSPAHLGETGLGLENSGLTLHSDTLYSALWLAWQKLYKTEMPELTLSSAYPFSGKTLFMPRPMLPMPGYDPDIVEKEGIAKDIKKIRYVSMQMFEQWISGKEFNRDALKSVANPSARPENNIKTTVRPKVALDRITCASSIYFYGETHFSVSNNENNGLHFMVDCSEDVWKHLKPAVRLLGDEGIGGKRSIGYGLFKAEFKDEEKICAVQNPTGWMSISLVSPEDGEEQAASDYQLVERTGWVQGINGAENTKHRRIAMFGEGSIFTAPVKGRIVDVTPQGCSHPCFRNGRAFMIPVKKGKNNR